MTYLEKLKQEYPKADVDELIREGCPDSYGYEKDSECRQCEGWNCAKCWNREMPNTETKAEILKEIHEHFNTEEYDIGYAEGLEQGLNDAWELAKKIYAIDDRSVVFDGHVFVENILNSYSPQEVLAKLKAYEDSKIEVGDVVVATEDLVDEIKGVVMDSGSQKFLWQVFTESGHIELWKECEFRKTGKHIDIKSFLEQIRG